MNTELNNEDRRINCYHDLQKITKINLILIKSINAWIGTNPGFQQQIDYDVKKQHSYVDMNQIPKKTINFSQSIKPTGGQYRHHVKCWQSHQVFHFSFVHTEKLILYI